MKTAWRELREEAAFMVPNPAWTLAAPETVPQMIPDLRVPAVEISLMLGHLPREGSSTSLIYAPYDPDYCRKAIKAIDDYCAKLKRLVKRPMKPPFDPALRVSCVLEGPGKTTKLFAKRLIWMVGATGIEPVTPTMSTKSLVAETAEFRHPPMLRWKRRR